MGNNMKRLGDVLSSRMQRTVKRNTPTIIELGKINSDMSLTTDGISGSIRPSDYMVDICFTKEDYKLKAGDRVLVAWVGYEPIIVSRIVSGTHNTT